MRGRSVVKTHLLLILATFFWGTSPLFMKFALKEIPFLSFNTFRLFSALTASLIMLLFSKGAWKKIKRKDWNTFIIAGFFGFFIFQICYPLGLTFTPVSIAAIIMATLPVSVMLINLFTGLEKPTTKIIIGISLSVLGAGVIAIGAKGNAGNTGTYAAGVFLILGAKIASALYTVRTKQVVSHYSLFQIIFIIVSFSLIPFTIISAKQLVSIPYSSISTLAWISILYSGILGICIGNMFWYRGIDHLGSTKTSLYANLPPVFGILSGFIFLKESLTLIQIAGGIVIAAGVILVNRKTA